jgi:hypothetical protein
VIFSLIKKRDFCGFSDQLFRINEKYCSLVRIDKDDKTQLALFSCIHHGFKRWKKIIYGENTNLKAMEED